MASNLPFYDIFALAKNSSFKVSDYVIACDLWFGVPPLIKNPGYAYAFTVLFMSWRPRKTVQIYSKKLEGFKRIRGKAMKCSLK